MGLGNRGFGPTRGHREGSAGAVVRGAGLVLGLAAATSCVVRSVERRAPNADDPATANRDVEGAPTTSVDGGSPTTAITSPRELARALARSRCHWYSRCGYRGSSEEASCVEAALASLDHYATPFSADDALAAGRVAFDADAAAACAEAQEQAGCTARDMRKAQAVCATVVRGSVANGASCVHDTECASGYCAGAALTGGCPGVCRPLLAAGASCETADAAPCGTDTFCDLTTGRCATRRGEGATCDGDHVCIQGLVCRRERTPDGGVSQGSCGPAGTRGESCATSYDCALPFYCDATNRCAERRTEDGTCASNEDCVGTTYCDVLAPEPRCRPWKDVGASCNPSSRLGSGCPTESPCSATTSTCTPTGRSGDPCTGLCREGLYCNDGTCAPKVRLGAACTTPDAAFRNPCHDGVCTKGACTVSCAGAPAEGP